MVADPVQALKAVFEFSGLEAEDDDLTETAIGHIDAFVSGQAPEGTGYADRTLILTTLQVGKGYRYMNTNQIERIRQSALGALAMELGYPLGEG